MKNVVCKTAVQGEYPGFTVQTEQVDFQSELYSYKIYRKTT